jgi:hypothetical protein
LRADRIGDCLVFHTEAGCEHDPTVDLAACNRNSLRQIELRE